MEPRAGPFIAQFIDTVGAIAHSVGERKYIAVSGALAAGGVGLLRLKENPGGGLARLLAGPAFLGVAGCPSIPRSGRGAELTGGAVAVVNTLPGFQQAFGRAFRPEGQGDIDGVS